MSQKGEIANIECSIYTDKIETLEAMIVHANVGCVAGVEPNEPMSSCLATTSLIRLARVQRYCLNPLGLSV